MARVKPNELQAVLTHGMRNAGFDVSVQRDKIAGNWTIHQLKTWTDKELAILNSELSDAIADRNRTDGKLRAMYNVVKERVTRVRLDRAWLSWRKDGKKNSKG